eukprot:7384467-Prymnesium_polylepis.2
MALRSWRPSLLVARAFGYVISPKWEDEPVQGSLESVEPVHYIQSNPFVGLFLSDARALTTMAESAAMRLLREMEAAFAEQEEFNEPEQPEVVEPGPPEVVEPEQPDVVEPAPELVRPGESSALRLLRELEEA